MTLSNSAVAQLGVAQVLEALEALDGPADSVFAVDGDRKVIYVGRGVAQLLDVPSEEILGQSCIAAGLCTRCDSGCSLSASEALDEVEMTFRDRSGARVAVQKSAIRLVDDDGRFVGAVETLQTRAPVVRLASGAWFHDLVAADPVMLEVFDTIRQVGPTSSTVLLQGESGTGKEGLARALHLESARRHGPFVAANCAAMTPALARSELFGHLRGSFTGASTDRRGLFQAAHGGTLFLDEISELPLESQGLLLRVLERGVIQPIGSSSEHPVDVRIVAATNRDLREEVRAGTFRLDLLYRLQVVPVHIPPLRERPADLDLLLDHFVAQRARCGPRVLESIAPAARRWLRQHSWPGNVRELAHAVEYACATGRGPVLELFELLVPLGAARTRTEARRLAATLDTVGDERDRIVEALEATGGQVAEAAERLGMSRATFWRKRCKYGL